MSTIAAVWQTAKSLSRTEPCTLALPQKLLIQASLAVQMC